MFDPGLLSSLHSSLLMSTRLLLFLFSVQFLLFLKNCVSFFLYVCLPHLTSMWQSVCKIDMLFFSPDVTSYFVKEKDDTNVAGR